LAEADEASSIRLAWRIKSSWAWVARRWELSCLWEVRIRERRSSVLVSAVVVVLVFSPGPGVVTVPVPAVRTWALCRVAGSVGFPLRVDLDDTRLVDRFRLGVSVVSAGLVVRGDAADGRCPRAGAGVAGVLGTAPAAEELRLTLEEVWSSSCRDMSGDLNGFLRVALAASIRRRLAAGPPGVWNDIL
jgi:hypothetical protein